MHLLIKCPVVALEEVKVRILFFFTLFECWFIRKPSFDISKTNIFWKVLVTDKRIIWNIFWVWHHRSIISFTTVPNGSLLQICLGTGKRGGGGGSSIKPSNHCISFSPVQCFWLKPEKKTRSLSQYPILERGSTVLLLLLLLLLLRHAQGTPPEFWNGLDWRALVKD